LAVLRLTTSSERRRLLDRQIGGLGAVKHSADIGACLAKVIGDARSIADQATGHGEFRPRIDRRNGIASRQCYELVAHSRSAEERIGGDDERADMPLGKGVESGVDLAFAAGLQDT